MSAGRKRPLPQSDDDDDDLGWVNRTSTPAPKRSSSSAPSVTVAKSSPTQASSSRQSPRRTAPEVSAVEKYDSEDDDATVTVKTKERRKNSQLADTPESVR